MLAFSREKLGRKDMKAEAVAAGSSTSNSRASFHDILLCYRADHCSFSKKTLEIVHTFCFMAKLTIAYSPWRRAPGFMIGLPCILCYNKITGRIYRQCERARAPAASCPRA